MSAELESAQNIPPPPQAAGDDSLTLNAVPEPNLSFRYSLSGMMQLLVVISVELLIISFLPWTAIFFVPLTIAVVRTVLVSNHRSRLGNPLVEGEWIHLFYSTATITVICCFCLVLAATAGFGLGALLQVMTFGSGPLLFGGICGALISTGLMAFGWWRSIQQNWFFDLSHRRLTRAEFEAQLGIDGPSRPTGRMNFSLMLIFEVMTIVAIFSALAANSPKWIFVIIVPFVAGMIYTTRLIKRKQRLNEPVTLTARYTAFLRAFVIASMILVSLPLAFVCGSYGVGSLAEASTNDRRTADEFGVLGGLAYTIAVCAVWVYGLRAKAREAREGSVDKLS